MKKLSVLRLLLSVPFLCGCVPVPDPGNVPVDTEEWCSRDDRMPWTGCWTEAARIDCESGWELEPENPIGEFRLTPDGRFSVTWSPFETYVDYAGPYNVNEKTGAIELTLGDLAPLDAKGQGRFTITDEGELLLEGVWLGSRASGSATVACGHRMQLKSRR
jgi:hypothetical protein